MPLVLPTHKIPRPNHHVEQPAEYCPMRCAKRSNWSNGLVKKLKTGCKTNVLVRKMPVFRDREIVRA